jgi:hypothetical protein
MKKFWQRTRTLAGNAWYAFPLRVVSTDKLRRQDAELTRMATAVRDAELATRLAQADADQMRVRLLAGRFREASSRHKAS